MVAEFRVEDQGETLLVSVSGVLDLTAVIDTGTVLLDIGRRAAAERKGVIVDLAGVQSVSSALIGKLALLRKLMKGRGLKMKVQNLPPYLVEVIRSFREDDYPRGNGGG